MSPVLDGELGGAVLNVGRDDMSFAPISGHVWPLGELLNRWMHRQVVCLQSKAQDLAATLQVKVW